MKRFVAGLALLLAGLGLNAQEAPIALRESSWPEPGRVSELRALHDLRGGVYVPYIADGLFTVLRTDGTGKLSPYMPEGFTGAYTDARKLKAIDSGSERYLAFIGGSGGGESICLFGFGFWNDLSYCPLPETGAAAITDYALVPSGDGVTVYTLAAGRLGRFSTGMRSATRRSAEISRPGETVEAFGVFRERNQSISYGWYRIAHKDYWEISLFSLDDAGNLVLEKTGARSCVPRLEHGISPEGNAVFAVIAGSAVSVCHAEGPRFVQDLRFDAPVTAKRYSPALLTGASTGLLIGEAADTEMLYGVSHERSGAPALRELFARPSAEILELFFTDENRISLLYRSGQTLFAALLGADGGVIADRPLPGTVPGAMLFSDALKRSRVRAVSESGSGELSVLSTLELKGETWRQAGEARIPLVSVGEARSITGVRNNALLLLVSPEEIMLFETETAAWQTLEMKACDLTIALNGVVYLAGNSGDGIVLCRIGE